MTAGPIELYDTTLRDGTQREGVSPTVADKLRVAEVIDALGVPLIEGGWPGANPKDTEFFKRAAEGELTLRHAQLAAFGMTRRPRAHAAGDPVLEALLEAGTPVVCVVGKASAWQVTEALGTTLDENLAMVAESIAHLRGEGRRVLFDAEHFFDGHRRDAAYALAVLEAAADAGAETVVCCDTNGGMLPDEVGRVVREVVTRVGARVQVGAHMHDDAACGVANSLAALDAGARHVQGTVNGIGERCGNADLLSVIGNLACKRGEPVVTDEALTHLTSTSLRVAELLNVSPDPHAAYVGTSAFAHKAGLHASALAKDPDAYQHIAPERVGNSLRMLVSELAGRSTVVLKAEALGLNLPGDVVDRVLERVKEREHAGSTFEAADASFELLVREVAGELAEPYRLESYRVISERRAGGAIVAEATVKIVIQDERLIGTAEGNGPVDALDHAFRMAVNGRFPALDELHLADYTVRILDGHQGTSSTTRVLVSSVHGDRELTTVGVSPNVIEASWRALSDAYLTVLG